MLTLTGEIRRWEPRRLRLRLLSAAAQIVTTARCQQLKGGSEGGEGDDALGQVGVRPYVQPAPDAVSGSKLVTVRPGRALTSRHMGSPAASQRKSVRE
ncbi:hypothetical protein ACE1SV_66200 [Streptomyces sp. E-15]